MESFSRAAEAIAATARKNEKRRILSDFFRSRVVDEAAASAMFFSGRPFPAFEETTLGVGGALLWRAVLEVADASELALTAAYRRHGDLGMASQDVLEQTAHPLMNTDVGLSVLDVATAFRQIASARGPASKDTLLRDLLARATPLEAKYIIKIITGELRIGLKESLVEESIAAAYGALLAEVQRANMLLGDIGETLRLAVEHRLGEARMRLFHPLGFMLASPAESVSEAFEYFQHAVVEDKYDGIRAQAHISGDHVRLFSRTLDELSESFPELLGPLTGFQGELILDGEILAWDFENQHARPFAELQRRLGRKDPTPSLMRQVPVAYVAFDVLYFAGELVITKPLHERSALLDHIFQTRLPRTSSPVHTRAHQHVLPFEMGEPEGASVVTLYPVLRAPSARADSTTHLSELFEAALARGNEGLMVKDCESPYTPGRRGRSWLKLKRELATLDVVVTSVEWGHGRRIHVLSDYTFAVRGIVMRDNVPQLSTGESLFNVGKAYSGLTDAEISQLTEWFLAHTIRDHGFWLEVEPKIVLEVAFNAVMRSNRHNSGYALRFPRILRLRPDKRPEEIDNIERVQEIYQRQKLTKSA